VLSYGLFGIANQLSHFANFHTVCLQQDPYKSMPEPVMDGSFVPGTAKSPKPFEFAPPEISNHFGV